MKDVLELIVNYGAAFVVLAYFLWRDYKFQIKLVESLQVIKDTLVKMDNK
jgi:hypothetical protein